MAVGLPGELPRETLAETVHRLLPHMDRTGKGDAIHGQLTMALARERTYAPEYANNAAEIRTLVLQATTREHGRALEGLARSWDLTDPACQALALADAQVWATLHLAEITQRVANQLDMLGNLQVPR